MQHYTTSSKLDLASDPQGKGWDDDERILSLIDTIGHEKEQHDCDAERQAELNIAWWRGLQELFWHQGLGELVRQPNPYHRVRLRQNFIAGIVDGFVAKLGFDAIRLIAEPATDDLADFDTAHVQTQVLNYYRRAARLPELGDRVDLASTLCGETFVKVVWNPDAGSEFDVLAEDLDMDPENFQKEYGREAVALRQGDLAVSGVSIFNLYWGPSDAEWQDAEYIFEVVERSKAHVMERYKLDPEDLETAYERGSYLSRPGLTTAFGRKVTEADDDKVLVRTLWVKPFTSIKGLERGRHVVAIGGKIVKNGPNPYNHQRFPYVRFPLRIVPEERHGDTFVGEMIPIQADINATVSQFAENRETMANPVWLANENAIVDPSQWHSKPGGVRFIRGSRVPELKAGVSMPNNILVHVEKCKLALQEIAGLRDVSQGRNPPGVRSGKAIALLKEGDDERMARIALRRREAWAEVGQLILHTVSQFATEERTVRIGGEEAESETLTFSGPMLRGGSRLSGKMYDVRVRSNGPPQSKSVTLENLDRLMERGFLRPDNPDDKSLVLDVLQMGSSRIDEDPREAARNLQHKRNRLMLQGQYTEPAHYEDPDTLLRELARFQRRPFFRDLDPEIVALFDQYEQELIALMAIRQVRLATITQQAKERWFAEHGMRPPKMGPETA